MSQLARLLLVCFLESLATMVLERGVYFYTHDDLDFSDARNLGLALAFGVAYVAGAQASHRISVRISEKRLLLISIAGQLLLHLLLALRLPMGVLAACFILVGFCNALKWPVLESYISAGRTPLAQSQAIGQFSIAWAIAVPLSLFVTGPLIEWYPPSLLYLAAATNLWTLWLLRYIKKRPAHLPHDHPQRISPGRLEHYRSLKQSFQWSLFASYTLLFLAAPLMPSIFEKLGYDVLKAPLSGVLDVLRIVAFVVMHRTAFWHGRRDLPLGSALLLPVGFFLIVLGNNTAVVLLGGVIFGLASGMVYYAALYYGMVIKNASVDAGGAHESLIGLGFAVGPLAGLAGIWLGQPMEASLGLITGVGPVVLLCVGGAMWALARHRRRS